jgi:hypothetical protein
MMNDFLKLEDKTRCPSCGYKHRVPVNGSCSGCGVRLFPTTDPDFRRFTEETGIRHFFAFHNIDGWKHADHFLISDAKPLHRNPSINPIPKNYGRKTTPGEVAGRGGKISKRKRERLLA